MTIRGDVGQHLINAMTGQVIEHKLSYTVAGASLLLGATLAEIQSWFSVATLFLGVALTSILIVRNLIGVVREYRELKLLKKVRNESD